MDITAYTHEQIAVIELSGRFDAHFAPQVKVLIERSDTPVQVLINLTAVTFIDSAALATLVSGMKRCRHVGGDLRLCGLQQSVKIIFELTRLDRAFSVYPNEDAALSSFHERPV